jgi:hypothetical protein
LREERGTEARIPATNHSTVIPTPARQDPLESPPSPERVPAQEDGPSWYFRGVSLGFETLPGISRPEGVWKALGEADVYRCPGRARG